MKFVGALLAFGLLLFLSGCLGSSEESMRVCSTDDDCIMVNEDCCGCQNGGESTAINKIYAEEWNSRLATMPCGGCLTVSLCGGTQPKCVSGRCELGVPPEMFERAFTNCEEKLEDTSVAQGEERMENAIDCYRVLARGNQPAENCMQLSVNGQFACLVGFAREIGDLSICELSDWGPHVDDCVEWSVEKVEDCAALKDAERRTDCIEWVQHFS